MSIKNKIFLSFTALCMASPYAAIAEEKKDEDIYNLSLEELGKVQLYSASKRPEKLSETASSAFVLTSEDIKRSGATSVPEVLRLVPGVQVARIDGHTWAISIRGFNRQYSNKLLVMIDGRTVYNPLFSGVFWDEQDYVLEDIERIEVIRGPGGTLWGANAVNGVINIITKEARKTQGNYVSYNTGSYERNITEYRYGGNTGNTGFYRVYGKYRDSKSFIKASDGSDANDSQEYSSGGFRYDFRNQSFDNITLQGDIYSGNTGLFYRMPQPSVTALVPIYDTSRVQGGNVMGHWSRNHDNGSKTDINSYIDYTYRDNTPLLINEKVTYDIDIQNSFKKGINEIIYGGGFRFISDNINNTSYVAYDPESSTQNIFSFFAQDKINIFEKTFLTIGSKFENNEYTGFEIQPNLRLSYLLSDTQSVWAAVSRAVRTPQRGEDTFSKFAIPGAPLGTVNVVGNKGYDSEELIAYEVGYRTDVTKDFYVDISTFYNDYDSLRTTESIGGGKLTSFNRGNGETYGFEIYGVYAYNDQLDFKTGYSLLKQNFHKNIGSTDTTLEPDETRSPSNQVSFSAMYKPRSDITFDNYIYYVDNLSSARIEPYIRYDTRLAWEPRKNLEFSITGQNLLDDYHPEFNENLLSVTSEVPRAVIAGVSYKF